MRSHETDLAKAMCMFSKQSMTVALLGVTLTTLEVSAVATPRTREAYQIISERNPFGLKPPPPPVEAPVAETKLPPPVKVDIFLTGITTVGYPSEGQGKDTIEVVEINEKRPASVTIRVAGAEQVLTFETNGIKPPTSGPIGPGAATNSLAAVMPGGGGAGVAQFGGGLGQPNNRPSGGPQNASGGLRNNIPERMRRSPSEGAAALLGFQAPSQLGAPSTPPNQPPPPEAEIDPVDQYLRLKIDETLNRQQGKDFPPIPQLH
ncbi:MAG: hypothetical protein NTV12_09935 [Verrucomicrobia bacterium]|nr:hypothetical protein [Verrucomicrobiota bacterium]